MFYNMFCHFFLLLLMMMLVGSAYSKGFSKQISDSGRLEGQIIEEKVPCEMPAITPQLPTRIRSKIELIWQHVEKNGNCWIEMAQTRNVLLRLTSAEKSVLLRKSRKECKVPSVVHALPQKYQRKITDIWEKNINEKVKKEKDCWEQQRKTRLLLLNLPMGVKFHPPAFECALPHFYNRLEQSLQEKLRDIWKGYKKGSSCVEQIDRQIQLLESNDISLKSFQMPPPSMFRKQREVRRKLRRRANVA
ncbi:hypothetical protein CRE_16882 [Caenorhabditis remanei]|uniref:Uncharacterized protein n=2 Tax=Caenorhabditis remanei TaxID=31234 RepID=E3MS59_CAERE|nr:hypothetical protein CRE_16882 [Caenorhabditis remanei]